MQDPDVLPVESEREGGGGGGGDERTELLLAATFLLMVILRWYWQNDVANKSQLCLLIFPACIPDDYHKFSTLNDLYLVTLFNIQFPGLPHPPMRETPASTSPSSPSLSFPGLGCHPGRDQYHHHHHHHH